MIIFHGGDLPECGGQGQFDVQRPIGRVVADPQVVGVVEAPDGALGWVAELFAEVGQP